jgi:hypothetical protein
MSTLVLDAKLDKKADVAGPGIGDYKELGGVLPKKLPLPPYSSRDAAGHFSCKALCRKTTSATN